MTTETDRLVTEIAHILFIDIVGYSQRPMEEQAKLLNELSQLVGSAPEFQRALARQELVPLDRGDGMALVFSRDPVSPVQCAVEIARRLGSPPRLQLRMGVNSGPVSRLIDINGRENFSGDGMNMGQRVMDCGDAGHILLSQSVADVLGQFAQWATWLHDLGVCGVKHGVRLHLYNLYLEDVGNPATPNKLRAASAYAAVPATTAAFRSVPEPAITTPQVAILYKRNAPHADHLLNVLEKGLTEAGYKVFIDRHMAVGVDWAQEIKRQMWASYAVVPLLSAESIWSEMVEEEVQTAHEASQQQGGKPRILPVRVAYEGALPERSALAAILNPLHYTLWHDPQDDESLVSEMVKALQQPAQPAGMIPREKLEPVGGAVPLDSEFYIVRPTDEEFATAIARHDSIVLVKGARQMGKTSLLARGLHQARLSGARCIRSDFQKLNAIHLKSDEALFLTLAEMIADQLDLDVLPEEVWNSRRGVTFNFERYLRREVLARSEAPVVWALDEVDKLFACPFGSDVFALFRSWHNERSLDPEGPWSKLTMAIAYATEAHLFITDLNQSPFNVGTHVRLEDFTVEEVAELNRRYGSPLRDAGEVARFHELVGGQPYLVRRGLDHMAAHRVALADLEKQADRDEGMFGDHLRRLLLSLSQDPQMTEMVRQILRGQSNPSAAAFYRLRSGGLLTGSSEHDFRVRCQLYVRYLERHLL